VGKVLACYCSAMTTAGRCAYSSREFSIGSGARRWRDPDAQGSAKGWSRRPSAGLALFIWPRKNFSAHRRTNLDRPALLKQKAADVAHRALHPRPLEDAAGKHRPQKQWIARCGTKLTESFVPGRFGRPVQVTRQRCRTICLLPITSTPLRRSTCPYAALIRSLVWVGGALTNPG
jgi:hypothetical protein